MHIYIFISMCVFVFVNCTCVPGLALMRTMITMSASKSPDHIMNK